MAKVLLVHDCVPQVGRVVLSPSKCTKSKDSSWRENSRCRLDQRSRAYWSEVTKVCWVWSGGQRFGRIPTNLGRLFGRGEGEDRTLEIFGQHFPKNIHRWWAGSWKGAKSSIGISGILGWPQNKQSCHLAYLNMCSSRSFTSSFGVLLQMHSTSYGAFRIQSWGVDWFASEQS